MNCVQTPTVCLSVISPESEGLLVPIFGQLYLHKLETKAINFTHEKRHPGDSSSPLFLLIFGRIANLFLPLVLRLIFLRRISTAKPVATRMSALSLERRLSRNIFVNHKDIPETDHECKKSRVLDSRASGVPRSAHTLQVKSTGALDLCDIVSGAAERSKFSGGHDRWIQAYPC